MPSLAIISQLIEILAPVFICVGLGALWIKRGQAFDTPMVTRLVTMIGTPALVFYALASAQLDTASFWQMGLSAVIAYFSFLLIGTLLLPLMGLSRQAFLQCITFPNIGNMGLPICYLAFGDAGLALSIAFFVVYVVLQFTVGLAIVQGSFTPKMLIDMPVIPATVLAIVFLANNMAVPTWLLNTTKMIGDLTIPLMLFTLGVSLASLTLGNLRVAFSVATLRFVLGLGVGIAIVVGLGLDVKKSAIVILQCSMPVAVYAYLFAQLYDQRAEAVAGTVMVSTLMSLVSLPLVLFYVL